MLRHDFEGAKILHFNEEYTCRQKMLIAREKAARERVARGKAAREKPDGSHFF